MKTLLIFTLLCSGCAMKSVEEVCDERMSYGAYNNYAECYREVNQARSEVFSQASNIFEQSSKQPERQESKQTDMKCMKDCRAAGYRYDFCESRCSY